MIRWVADHRRHHAFSDQEGDPHSPWRYGDTVPALLQGPLATPTWAGCSTASRPTSERFAPDLLADRDIVQDRAGSSRCWAGSASVLPAVLLGGLVTWSWAGALTAFFWAAWCGSALLHHVTWSINSICHASASGPFIARDRSRQLLVAGDPLHRRVVAQPAPRRPDLRPARRAARPDRHSARRDLALREARLGVRRAVADRPSGSRPPRRAQLSERPSVA